MNGAPGAVELVRAAFERWNEGIRSFDPETIHPDVEIISPLSGVAGEPYRGRAGFGRWVADLSDNFGQWRLEATEMREAQPGVVLVLGSVHLRGAGSGVSFEQPMGWLFEVERGRLRRIRIWLDSAEAERAAEKV